MNNIILDEMKLNFKDIEKISDVVCEEGLIVYEPYDNMNESWGVEVIQEPKQLVLM